MERFCLIWTRISWLKMLPSRSETYRRWVASLPCARCGAGPTQAAHYTGFRQHSLGAGRGIKAKDIYVAPLCPLCHALADSYQFSSAEDRYTRRLEQSEEFAFYVLQTIEMALAEGILK